MRHTLRLLGLLSLFTVGCRYPDDPIFAYGRALQANGSPLADTSLTVEMAPPRSWDMVNEPLKAPPSFTPYGTSTTQANGEFTQQFLAGDVEETVSGSGSYVQYRFRMALPLEEGQGTFLSFVFNGDVELPTLQPWDARFTVGAGPSLSFASAPPIAELPPSGKLRTLLLTEEPGEVPVEIHPTTPEPIVQLFSGGERLWLQSGVSSPWVPGPYVLEDFASPEAQLRAVSLGAWIFSPLGSIGSTVDFRQEWRTARLPLPAGASRPVSRGASCLPWPPDPCPWTDGQLTPAATFTKGVDPVPYSIVITLAEPARLSRAVIRGLEYAHVYEGAERLRLDGSVDGEHWIPLAHTVLRNHSRLEAHLQGINEFFASNTSWDSPFDGKLELYDELPVFVDLPLESAEPVRHVRLQVEADDSEFPKVLYSLAEMSLFE